MSKSFDMHPIYSAIAETVKGRYRVNDALAEMLHSPDMNQWRDRLREAADASGKSRLQICKEARVGKGYLAEVLDNGKEPTFDRLLRVINAIGVSLPWILYGTEIGPEEEELITLFSQLPEKRRRAILDLVSGGE